MNIRRLTYPALTAAALCAFAANSILCRLALGGGRIGAVEFTVVRLISGAALLFALFFPRKRLEGRSSAPAGALLFGYAILFSLAYLKVGAGAGALVLFGSVQISMLTAGMILGHRITLFETVGAVVAFCGLCVLVVPSASSPPILGCILMGGAGAAWGLYTVLGKSVDDPYSRTMGAFAAASVLGVLCLPLAHGFIGSAYGVALAAVSGAVTSAFGYVIWFLALRRLSVLQAACVQLSVPVLAAAGGAWLLSETISPRLVLAGGMVFLGIGISLWAKASPSSHSLDDPPEL